MIYKNRKRLLFHNLYLHSVSVYPLSAVTVQICYLIHFLINSYTESSTFEDICDFASPPVELLGVLFLASAASSAASRRAAISSREGALGAIPLPLVSIDGADTTPSCGKPVAQVPFDEEDELPAKVCAEPGNYEPQKI